jgi:hypothetical protein
MTDREWKAKWIRALVDYGVSNAEADEAFIAMYGNQSFDINADPVADALQLVAFPTMEAIVAKLRSTSQTF